MCDTCVKTVMISAKITWTTRKKEGVLLRAEETVEMCQWSEIIVKADVGSEVEG